MGRNGSFITKEASREKIGSCYTEYTVRFSGVNTVMNLNDAKKIGFWRTEVDLTSNNQRPFSAYTFAIPTNPLDS